jgi:hypothetical protein
LTKSNEAKKDKKETKFIFHMPSNAANIFFLLEYRFCNRFDILRFTRRIIGRM